MDYSDVISTIVVSTSAAVLLLAYFWLHKSNPKHPPSPLRRWPIVGNLLHLNADPREQLNQLRKQCGDIYSLWLGYSHVVVLNGLAVVKEALVTHGEDFSDRAGIFANVLPEGVNKGIAFSNGAVWKEHRSFCVTLLRNLTTGQNILNDKIDEEVHHMVELLESFKEKPTDIQTLTNKCISNIVCSIILGHRYDYDDKEFNRIMELTNYSLSQAKRISLSNYMPWLRFLPGDFFRCKLIKVKVKEFCKIFADNYVREDEEIVEKPNSLISAYFLEMEKKRRTGEMTHLDKSNLIQLILDMFVAGTDTTSSTLDWFFLYMVNYPEIQEAIFNEIDKQVGLERAVVMQDRPSLTYLTATIMEVQRLASLIALNLPRILSRDVQLQGYTLPKGAEVVINFQSILHDHVLWGDDADQFRHDRFINSDGDLLSPEAGIPFSLGRRVCVGENMAKMELFLFISNILQRFQVVPANPNAVPSITGKFGTTHAPLPYNVRFVFRRSR